MPEGDTLFKIASRLDAVGSGERIVGVTSREPSLMDHGLEGDEVDRVEARGKHLLIHFASQRVLHSHLRMEGSWHVVVHGAPWPKPRKRLTIGIELSGATMAGFSLPTVELLRRSQLVDHRSLRALGPDLLGRTPDVGEMIKRIRRHPKRAIGEAIMDQRNCAGIGNVYKSELLFMRRVHPLTAVSAMEDEQLKALLVEAVKWLRRNLLPGRRRTRWGHRPNHWVYGKAGERCGVCDGTVTRLRQGPQNRSTYLCVGCQPPPEGQAMSRASSLLTDY